MGQNDTIGKIELNPSFVLSSDNTNYKNDIQYRSGTVNSNTVNSKFHLIRSCCEYLARFLSFHV